MLNYRAAIFLIAALPASGQDLATRARAYLADPTAAHRASVVQYAGSHAGTQSALAHLALGSKELELKRYPDAVQDLELASKHLPDLADYSAYLTAAARFESGEPGGIDRLLRPVWEHNPPSPLVAKAAILLANALLRQNEPKPAIAVVEKHRADLKPQQTEILLAHAYEIDGNGSAATTHYQRILVDYPLSTEAADAESDPSRLAGLSSQARLARCTRLLEAGEAKKSRAELDELLPGLSGAELDTVRVKLGAAQFGLREYRPAFDYLNQLEIATPEADAERLYYLIRCARRLDLPQTFQASLERLARLHSHSTWRLKALQAVGDYYFLENDVAAYEPVYRTCAEAFAGKPEASQCQWRVGWAEYLLRQPGANDSFAALLKRYPGSDKASNALYFLARIAESKGDLGTARAYFEEIEASYPNYFYATLAREKLRGGAVSPAARPVNTAPAATEFVPSPLTLLREKRARLLASAGLDDLAESELRFAAKRDGQPLLAAMELAELAEQRNAPDQGIRFIKQLAPNYLRIPIEAAPERFWKLAFPLPFRPALERHSREQSLDPYLVAALIRQESEFNPKVISRANAYGLTQVLPSTGREIGRKMNVRGFRADMLFQPEINLQIGAYFLRSLLDRLQGNWEAALASYNAGPARVAKWLAWGEFREPAEFIETIPFDETRNYVQSVLRNADLYRRLYGSKPIALASSHGDNSGKDAGAAGGIRNPAAAIP